MGKGGVLAAKGRFKGSKGSEGGPNCSTSQTSDRRTILAQLRHPKVRKHTPAPLEPPPASTNAVGRVTTSTKKDLGDALISPLAIHPHEPKAAQNDLAHASFVPTEPPPAPAPTLTHQRPAALPHPAKPKSVRETRPARADVSSRGHSQHKTTAPPPHRLSRVLSFLDLSLSLSLHPQTTPRVSPSSPFDTPPHPPYKRTQPPSWATPTPTSSRSTRSASWLCVLPLIPQQFLAASPRPRHSVGVAALPHHQWMGGKKKETMVFSASNHGNARGGMKMQSMGCAVAHHSRVTGRCHRTCQLRPPRRANVRNPDELRCRPVPANALSGAWRLLPTSSGTSS